MLIVSWPYSYLNRKGTVGLRYRTVTASTVTVRDSHGTVWLLYGTVTVRPRCSTVTGSTVTVTVRYSTDTHSLSQSQYFNSIIKKHLLMICTTEIASNRAGGWLIMISLAKSKKTSVSWLEWYLIFLAVKPLKATFLLHLESFSYFFVC